MAITKIEVVFEWENDNFFKLTTKEDGGAESQVVRMDENGTISELWPAASNLCTLYVQSVMRRILADMIV